METFAMVDQRIKSESMILPKRIQGGGRVCYLMGGGGKNGVRLLHPVALGSAVVNNCKYFLTLHNL
jgi:hypothetical protein